jgi:hypothetical protein
MYKFETSKKDKEFVTAKRDKSITFSTTSSLEAHQPAQIKVNFVLELPL